MNQSQDPPTEFVETPRGGKAGVRDYKKHLEQSDAWVELTKDYGIKMEGSVITATEDLRGPEAQRIMMLADAVLTAHGFRTTGEWLPFRVEVFYEA
jgi:hypothetical protein